MERKKTGELYVMVAKLPAAGVEKFNEYESLVLPLLQEHGALLERRLQSSDKQIEVHLVWFPSTASFLAYRNNPMRSQYSQLLIESGVSIELMKMHDLI